MGFLVQAASLPAIVSLLATPLVLYKLYPPETKDTPDAPAMATKKSNIWVLSQNHLNSLWLAQCFLLSLCGCFGM
ncbi:hypothetical protein GBA52_026700 [Prunus armeniaca]|nr:hypothetical protein GBA52_026700 [Prunus armeniaca]